MNESALRLDPGAGTPDSGRETDKCLYATLSLYIPAEKLTHIFGNWTRQKRVELRDAFAQTQELREAIDPLFNDIAIRDRNSTIDEFLIDVKGKREVEKIIITLPQRLVWQTEGKTFAVNLGQPVEHELICRMFWYAHTDGALSYHISFFMKYSHGFEDYYFLSMFQKLMFPKEFCIAKGADRSKLTPDDITSGNTGLWLLDEPLVSALVDYSERSLGRQKLSFWQYMKARFTYHLEDLITSVGIEFREGLSRSVGHAKQLWDRLVEQCDFIEVPHLKAPASRALFLFQDEAFFRLLQEEQRLEIRSNKNYRVHMPEAWEKLDIVEIKKEDFDRAPDGDFDIRYYFLSGFFQNIIDFLNQDISEIRDGTDPIYPVTEEQQEEAYFIRLANGRAIYQVVERSRSLEVGKDFIGTCPYIFLVHLMVLHNEFLVRKYELEATEVQDKLSEPDLTAYGDLQALLNRKAGAVTKTSELQKVTQPFYAFRYKAFTVYRRHLYLNTLRYDTERDVFEKLQQIRSTEPRLRRCDEITAGLDRTINDIEEERRYQDQRLRSESDRILNLAVLGVAIFSAFQVLYIIADKLDDVEDFMKKAEFKVMENGMPIISPGSEVKHSTELITLLDLFSVIFLAVFLIASVVWIRRRRADRP